MSFTDSFLLGVELVGTAAFASSGALVGIRKNMDLMGVLSLGLTTALGGGLIRDLILGIHPPKMFENAVYAFLALATSLTLFLVVYRNTYVLSGKWLNRYERGMNFFDALGLGIFTVIGIKTAVSVNMAGNTFLLVFVGMATGVGGGLIRDVLAQEMPFILVKQIYASASLAGALLYIACRGHLPDALSTPLCTATVVLIRILAVQYNWNLPRSLSRQKRL